MQIENEGRFIVFSVYSCVAPLQHCPRLWGCFSTWPCQMDIAALLPKRGINNGRSNMPEGVGQTHVSKMNSCLILYVVNMFYNYICKRFANQLWFPKLFANVQQIGCAFVKRTSLTDMIIRNI